MLKKLLMISGYCCFVLASVGIARADTVFYLNQDGCTGGCTMPGSNYYGTVDLNQFSNGSGGYNVKVTVTLQPKIEFVHTGAADALDFNLPTGSSYTFSDVASGFSTPTMSTTHVGGGFGDFSVFTDCTACGKGGSNPQSGPLYFTVDGVTIPDFTANSNGDYFVSDIIDYLGQNSNTGPVGSDGPVAPVVPEPPSLLLLGTGLAALAGLMKLRRGLA